MARAEQAWPHAVPAAGSPPRAADWRPLSVNLASRWQAWRSWLPGALVVLILSVPAWAPFIRPDISLWQLYDGPNHLRKAFFLAQLIKDGNWYPRWTPQEYEGFGYPTLNFYAPLTYYVLLAMAAVLPRIELYEALQLFGVLEAIAILAAIYALALSIWRHQPAAVLAAGAVAYSPYIFPNLLFLSGWIPQLLGIGLVAWLLVECFWLWRRLSEGRPAGRWWWAIALTTGALLMGHNASAIIGFPVILGWLVTLYAWRPTVRPVVYAATAAVCGALAAAVLWLPALAETALVQVERMERGNLNFRNHFLAWPGLHREDVWGLQIRAQFTPGLPLDFHLIYPNSAYGPLKLSMWQGVMALAGILALVAIGVVAWRRRRAGRTDRAGGNPVWQGDRGKLAVLSVVFGLIVFLVCYSQNFDWWLPAWERIAVLRAVQLPERFGAPALYGVALAGAGALALLLRPGWPAWIVAGAAIVVLGITGATDRHLPIDPAVSHEVSITTAIESQRSQPGFTDSTEEFTPRTAGYVEWHEGEPRGFWIYERIFPEAAWVAGRARAWQGQVGVQAVRGRLLWTEAEIEVGPGGGTLAFHQLQFPGWRAWIDGRPAPTYVTPFIPAQAIQPGFLLVDVPEGKHTVSIRFGPDGPRLAGVAVTLVTLAGVAAWLFRRGRHPGYALGGLALAAGILVTGCRTVQPLLGPAAPRASDQILVKNVIDDVVAGRAAVSSPSGAALGPDKFVDVRYLSVQAQDRPLRDAGASTRRWLFTHPPSDVSVDLTLPAEAYFQTSLALEPTAWEAPLGDGVRFVVTVTPRGGQPATVLDATVNPRAKGEQRRWLDVVADLRPWAGQDVRVTLRTDPRQDPTYDWAGWSEPAIVRLDALTAARMLDSTAQMAKLALGS